ncbi:MAG: hypothetical protein ACREKL_09980 [Chthoniobacterales bacterium]
MPGSSPARGRKTTLLLGGIALMLLSLPACFFIPRFQGPVFSLTFTAGFMLMMLSMKGRTLIWFMGGILPFIVIGGILVYPLVKGPLALEQNVASHRNPTNANEIAAACLKLLKNSNERVVLDDEKKMPPVIAALHPRWICVDPTPNPSVQIEFGGGFRSYGYMLEPLEPASAGWHLYFYDENDPEDSPPNPDLAVIRD